MSDLDSKPTSPSGETPPWATPHKTDASPKVRRSALGYGLLMLVLGCGAIGIGIHLFHAGKANDSLPHPSTPDQYILWGLLALVISGALFGVAAGIWKPLSSRDD